MPYEFNTAKYMNEAAASLPANFALALGDNFYTQGVKNVDDARFKHSFEDVFNGDHLSSKSGFQFKLLAGNHDHNGNVTAQVCYSDKSDRWHFPSLYYTFNETAPDGATVQFVMIDTVILAGNSDLEDGTTLHGSELPGPASQSEKAKQLKWIEETLAASTADYVIVGGHYPVWSVAEHGPTKQLSPKNFPLLQKYKVSAYLCGHDHAAEHIDTGDGIQYHVIGSAERVGSWNHAKSVPSEQVKFKALTKGGYSTVSVNKGGLVIKHFDGNNNKLLYTADAILPRGTQESGLVV